MTSALDVAVIGAGPYGLSVAAHLRAQGVSCGVFGPSMEVWREHMPKGMLLKSDGFASNLSDPTSSFTLKEFCLTRGIPYSDTKIPVAIETFIEYALAFQQKFVPDLDARRVSAVEREGDGFVIRLEDGESVPARRVVLAVGISHFSYVPPCLGGLPANLLSHSSAHNDCSSFSGRKVTVIGAGASAIDLAALMHESGAEVTIVARAPFIRFHNMPGPNGRSLWERMRNPSSGLGPGWKSRFFTDAPGVFRYFPEDLRLRIVSRHLGPAPGWPMKTRVVGKVPMILGHSVALAERSNGGVRLALRSQDGTTEEHHTDHVVAATGYRPDIRRLSFLGEDIRRQIQTAGNAPVLSRDFQASVPGLYFVGIAAANDFGPMMRFAYGSDYTARRLSSHLVKRAK
ncbi:MAG: NAD(P)-binding domain-containing protein [Acidobacteriaceae bacterium]